MQSITVAIISSLALLLMLSQSGECLKCYACSDSSPDDSMKCNPGKEMDCPSGLVASKYCVKQILSGDTVNKMCSPSIVCPPVINGIKETHCCETDLCNGGDHLKSSAILAFSVVALMVIRKFVMV